MSEDPDEIHRQSRAEALKQKTQWEDLLNGPAWSMVANFLADQKKMRIVRLLVEPDLSDKELHYLRGEAATLELIEKYPVSMRDTAANILEGLREQDARSSSPSTEREPLPGTIDDVDLPPDYSQSDG